MMSSLTSVTRSELKDDPHARLWALVFYLAERPELQQDKRFRNLWLAYTYDAEVLNGGHMQFFNNRGLSSVTDTIRALLEIRATYYSEILKECYAAFTHQQPPASGSVEQYAQLAQSRFSAWDSRYYSTRPEMLDIINKRYSTLIKNCVDIEP